jgi:hypothetical protein
MDRVEGLWKDQKSQFGERFYQKRNSFVTHRVCTRSPIPTGPPDHPPEPGARHVQPVGMECLRDAFFAKNTLFGESTRHNVAGTTCCPKQNRRGWRRCTALSSRGDAAVGSRAKRARGWFPLQGWDNLARQARGQIPCSGSGSFTPPQGPPSWGGITLCRWSDNIAKHHVVRSACGEEGRLRLAGRPEGSVR